MKAQWTLFFIISLSCVCLCVLSSLGHEKKIKICNLTQTHMWIICAKWWSTSRANNVLLEFHDVLHQVFICHFPGCCSPSLLKTSPGISWRRTYTQVAMYVPDKKKESYDPQIFIAKIVATVKSVAFFCLEVWDFRVILFFFQPMIVNCTDRMGPCVLGPFVALWCRGDELGREPACRACHSVTLPLSDHICLFSPFPHLFVCRCVSAFTSLCLQHNSAFCLSIGVCLKSAFLILHICVVFITKDSTIPLCCPPLSDFM